MGIWILNATMKPDMGNDQEFVGPLFGVRSDFDGKQKLQWFLIVYCYFFGLYLKWTDEMSDCRKNGMRESIVVFSLLRHLSHIEQIIFGEKVCGQMVDERGFKNRYFFEEWFQTKRAVFLTENDSK